MCNAHAESAMYGHRSLLLACSASQPKCLCHIVPLAAPRRLHLSVAVSHLSKSVACVHAEPPAAQRSALLCLMLRVSVSSSACSSSMCLQRSGPPQPDLGPRLGIALGLSASNYW